MLKRFFIIIISFSFLASHSAVAVAPTDEANTDPKKLNRLKIELGKRLFNEVESNPNSVKMFNKIYGGKPTPENIASAMTEYQQSLKAASRFDDYMHGNKDALTPEEIHGYELFKSYGCAACHNGANLGGSQFKKMGVAKNYFMEHKTLITPADLGLFEVTKNINDVNVFKVPSLRNIGVTYPYYHDGSVKSLDEAVRLMGQYQLGVKIPDEDVKAIVAFLKTLTSKSLEKTQE